MSTLQYTLKVNQKDNEIFRNLESEYIKKEINNFPNITLDNGFLKYNNNDQVDQTIYLNQDICAELYKTPSKESLFVPNMENYRFLVKNGIEYTYTKEKPIEDYSEDIYDLTTGSLSTDSIQFKRIFARSYPAIRLNQHHAYGGQESYSCFNLPYGGITKAYSCFYYVDGEGILTVIDPADNELYIDYLEGYIYLPNRYIVDIDVIYGHFNIEPINIIPKGDLRLDSNETNYYQLQNIPEKQLIQLFHIEDNYYGLISSDNAFAHLGESEVGLEVDGISFRAGQPIYLKKDVLYCISINDYSSVEVDFLLKIETIRQNSMTNYSKVFESSMVNKAESTGSDAYLYVYREVEKNTYNFERPLLLQIPSNVIVMESS